MRSVFIFSILLLTSVLSACAHQEASTVTPKDFISVSDSDQLEQYWVKKSPKGTRKFRATSEHIKALKDNDAQGYIRGVYWIDSDGIVSKIEIHESSPEGSFQDLIAGLIGNSKYKPGTKNPNARPARVNFKIELDVEDQSVLRRF